MKIIIHLVLFLFCLDLFAGEINRRAQNEKNVIYLAETIIYSEFAYANSHSFRVECEKSKYGCSGGATALILAIDTISISHSEIASKALLNLTGLALDAGFAEERDCQILNQGELIINSLSNMEPKQVIGHCFETYKRMKKEKRISVRDVPVEQMCNSENQVLINKTKLIKALKAKEYCE